MAIIYAKCKGEIKEILVDDEDYEKLSIYKWHVRDDHGIFYAKAGGMVKGKTWHLSMHRFIMGVTDPKVIIDHINHNGIDNRKCNLRICTVSENRKNARSKKKGTSKYLGVSKHSALKYINSNNEISYLDIPLWRASIMHEGKAIIIGHFESEEMAAKAYDKKARELHGAFANPNFK